MMTERFDLRASAQCAVRRTFCLGVFVANMVLVCSAIWSGQAKADTRFNDLDVARLPAYCRDTQSFVNAGYGSQEGYKARMQQLGPTFHHMHHYCLALVAMNHAFSSRSELQRNRLYNSAWQDLDYVIDRAPPDFVLLPEMLVRRGEALSKLKKVVLAETSFRKAIEMKPDYWPAYRDLAKLYIDLGKRDTARTTLESGLAIVSEKRVLQGMLDDLKRAN